MNIYTFLRHVLNAAWTANYLWQCVNLVTVTIWWNFENRDCALPLWLVLRFIECEFLGIQKICVEVHWVNLLPLSHFYRTKRYPVSPIKWPVEYSSYWSLLILFFKTVFVPMRTRSPHFLQDDHMPVQWSSVGRCWRKVHSCSVRLKILPVPPWREQRGLDWVTECMTFNDIWSSTSWIHSVFIFTFLIMLF